MIPGMDPRAMKAAMRKLGMQQQDLDATEVVIKLRGGHEIVMQNPTVAKVTMMGQETFQLSGEYVEKETRNNAQPLFTEDDVKTVVEQAMAPEAEATAALVKTDGDIAAAIMLITEKKEQ
jgi:nascent polypeptide-associated complex subunit alpha